MTDDIGIETCFRLEGLFVVGTGFADKNIFEDFSGLLLYDLLQNGFIILGSAVFEDRRLFLDIGKQEACGFLFPCIKIDGGKECLKGVGSNGLAEASAVQFLPVSEQKIIAQPDFVCIFAAGILADQCGAQFGQRTFRQRFEGGK